ncbi:MAG: class I SAM-dependent methyltransferase [Tepidisphaeraceae bacterium]
MAVTADLEPKVLRALTKKYESANWEKHLDTGLLQSVYDKQGWDGPMGLWRRRSAGRLIEEVAKLHGELKRKVRVLDVACFSGDYFARLDEQPTLAGMFEYTGVDVTPKYVTFAASRWSGKPHARFQEASAKQLPFADDEFDLVFNSGMLIHIDDPAACINEFARVAAHMLFVETTIQATLTHDFIDENKSGDSFIDRVYRPDFIRGLIGNVAAIRYETTVPYGRHESILIEATPK